MNSRHAWRFAVAVGAVAASICAATPSAGAQEKQTRGFSLTAPADATGEELNSQTNLWVLEVDFKPVRMLWVELTDPKTGQKSRELVWYVVYRAVNRPLERRQDDSDTQPVNELDAPPGPPMFAPEGTIVTDDGGRQTAIDDEVLPEAQAAINLRERQQFLNSVQLLRPIPPETPRAAKLDDSNTIHGILTWRGIDPDTDYFTLYLTGFSNGYRVIMGPDGSPLAVRKTIVQDFWRPGDRFDQTEREVRAQDSPRWVYRPDAPGTLAKAPPADRAAEQPLPADAAEAAAQP